MAEYIEREKLLLALNEWQKTLIKTYCENDEYVRCLESVFIGIESAPAADVRPVVLCRDCKHNYNTCLNHGKNQPMCDFTDRKLREDDFCSRGEKREES